MKQAPPPPLTPSHGLLGKASTLAEILLLLIAGAVLGDILLNLILTPGTPDTEALLFQSDPPRWSAAAFSEALGLFVRYGFTFLAAIAICWWIGCADRRSAGLTRNQHTLRWLIGFGVLMGLLIGAPVFALRAIHELTGWGRDIPMWELMRASEWGPEFWLFMAAGSFVVVPVVEELFFRCYALYRLRMHFGAADAIFLSGLIFWVAHGQYLTADLFLLANSALLFFSALVLAWSVVRTGSVIPAVIAHAVGNVPLTTPYMALFIVLAVAAAVVWRAPLRSEAGQLRSLPGQAREWKFHGGFLLVMVAGAIAISAVAYAVPVLAGLLVVLVLVGWWRRDSVPHIDGR